MIEKILHIGLTGRHREYYTKYLEVFVNFEGFAKHHITFKGNLTTSTSKAKEFAEEQEKSEKYKAVVFHGDTPLKWSGDYHLEAFGLTFKLSKARNVYWAIPNEEFWNAWKKNKEEIKKAGFWIKRREENIHDTPEIHWCVFVKSDGEYEEREPASETEEVTMNSIVKEKLENWNENTVEELIDYNHLKYGFTVFETKALLKISTPENYERNLQAFLRLSKTLEEMKK